MSCKSKAQDLFSFDFNFQKYTRKIGRNSLVEWESEFQNAWNSNSQSVGEKTQSWSW